jgi:hypothetical protein
LLQCVFSPGCIRPGWADSAPSGMSLVGSRSKVNKTNLHSVNGSGTHRVRAALLRILINKSFAQRRRTKFGGGGAAMVRQPSKKPRAVVKYLPDGHHRKRAPTGIRSTFLAIQNYWLALSTKQPNDEHLTPAAFYSEDRGGFRKAFEDTYRRYPAMKNKPDKVARLLQQLTSGKHNIEFAHLLAFAEHVRLPLSVFLLFTQMVSDELRSVGTESDFKAHALRTLRRIRELVEFAEKQVEQASPNQKIFLHEYDEFEEAGVVLARAQALKDWSDFYSTSATAGNSDNEE